MTKASVRIASLVASGAGEKVLRVKGMEMELAIRYKESMKSGKKKANTGIRIDSKRYCSMTDKGSSAVLGTKNTAEGGWGTSS